MVSANKPKSIRLPKSSALVVRSAEAASEAVAPPLKRSELIDALLSIKRQEQSAAAAAARAELSEQEERVNSLRMSHLNAYLKAHPVQLTIDQSRPRTGCVTHQHRWNDKTHEHETIGFTVIVTVPGLPEGWAQANAKLNEASNKCTSCMAELKRTDHEMKCEIRAHLDGATNLSGKRVDAVLADPKAREALASVLKRIYAAKPALAEQATDV